MVGGNAAERVKSFVQRVERLDEEIAGLNSDKSEVYKDAKSEGFDVTALKAVIAKRRKQAKNPSKFEEQQSLIEIYENALASGTENATRARVSEDEAA